MPAAERDFARFDPPMARQIRAELLALAAEADPRRHLKRLKWHRSPPFFSLRVGDHRVILKVLDGRLIIVVVEVGHRSTVYREVRACAAASPFTVPSRQRCGRSQTGPCGTAPSSSVCIGSLRGQDTRFGPARRADGGIRGGGFERVPGFPGAGPRQWRARGVRTQGHVGS